jgi:hypothetical protein
MASTLARFDSSGFLPVEAPKNTCVCDNEEVIHNHTVDTCQTIRNNPDIFARMRWSMRRRVDACIEFHEGHFEHRL